MVSRKDWILTEFFYSLELYGGETEDEDDVFEDDRSKSDGTDSNIVDISETEKSYVESESEVSGSCASLSNDEDLCNISETGLRSSLNFETNSNSLSCFFGNGSNNASRRKETVPILHKNFLKIEDALALLLLQLNPEDLMYEMNPEFIECSFTGGTKERLYTGVFKW